MANDFNRPHDGFRYLFGGMKTNSRPDALLQGKYPFAQNIRAYSDGTIQSRPGYSTIFSAGNYSVANIRAYSALSTDNLPRFLAYNLQRAVYLDTGALIGFLSGAGFTLGASMIPFRPNQSPTPWMYIADGGDYQKFSAPSATNVVTQQKVGIAEPQTAPDAFLSTYYSVFMPLSTYSWTKAGTAGSVSPGSRISDTVVNVLADPIPGNFTWNIEVNNDVTYQRLMEVEIGGDYFVVQDVFPALTSVGIDSIYYFSGTTGHCIIVPANIASGPGVANASIYQQNQLFTMRRGALLFIGAEVCMVWSVTIGPGGSVCVETSTTVTHTTSDTIGVVPSIQVIGGTVALSDSIAALSTAYQVTVGIGTESATLPLNPFVAAGNTFQPDDFITIGVLVDNLSNLNEMKILFDVGDGSFTENFYYYTVRPSDIAAAVSTTSPITQLAASQIVTQRAVIDEEDAAATGNQLQTFSSAQTYPGSGQWSQIVIPIGEMTRVGSDVTKSLQNVNSMQLLWNASGTINVAHSDMTIFGGLQPDVGDAGAPYLYRVRPRSSITGVVGNPSPAIRYGVNPRRTSVTVNLPSAAYDSQIDTWDVFRYGGSITSWRFVGSTLSSNSTFTDNFDDSAVGAGDPLDFDNFEPWPSVDVPNNGTASIVNGTIAVVSSTDTDITSYLPGTLVLLGGLNAYTLFTRPTLISGTSYLLQFVENAAAGASVPYQILEPLIANQHLPYMWGPDSSGTVFACGDSLRAGSIYFSKPYAPDSAPDSYNQEITPPSEPLLGGETIDGLAFVGSPERWWALYPQPQDARQRYSVIQQPFTRGLAAPFGHCNDGRALYWWAKDGIYSSDKGSLTDADLSNLFPREGIVGENVIYNGQTAYAPDYSRTGTFRLAHANGYLYAVYRDSTGTYRTLVCHLASGAWSVDSYSALAFPLGVSAVYHPEQQAGTVLTSTSRYPELLVGTGGVTGVHSIAGVVAQQTALTNDGAGDVSAGAITCALATNEFDGGDLRAPKQWGDLFIDLLPAANAGVTVSPMSLGVPAAAATIVPVSASRVRIPVGVGGIVTSDFLGAMATWTDDFSIQSIATKLFAWQPSFTIQPAKTISWATIGTSYGIDGYMHVRQLSLAYISTAPITITCTTYDGQDPLPITIPSSSGILAKALFPLSANKGQLYQWTAASSAPFQIFPEDSSFYVGEWGRQGPYLRPENFGGASVAPAVI